MEALKLTSLLARVAQQQKITPAVHPGYRGLHGNEPAAKASAPKPRHLTATAQTPAFRAFRNQTTVQHSGMCSTLASC
jgi:hypothetical protein